MADNNDSDSVSKSETTVKPAQIPLLEDIIYNTSQPLQQAKRKPKIISLESEMVIPKTTDLFGGPPMPAYQTQNLSAAHSLAKQTTAHVIDTLVEEYSTEIVRRLRDELNTILDDLDLHNAASKLIPKP